MLQHQNFARQEGDSQVVVLMATQGLVSLEALRFCYIATAVLYPWGLIAWCDGIRSVQRAL